MEEEWDLAKINSLIENGAEESQILEYKSSGALSKSEGKKTFGAPIAEPILDPERHGG